MSVSVEVIARPCQAAEYVAAGGGVDRYSRGHHRSGQRCTTRAGRCGVVSILLVCVQESVAGGRGAYCIPAEICEFLLVGQSAVLVRARVGGGGSDIPC